MSTLAWPALPADDTLANELAETLARELQWLLASLQEALHPLKVGLEECAALLAPTEPGATLVLSSLRSEALKGFLTRVGTRVVKGDAQLRLASLPPPRGHHAFRVSVSQQPTAPTIFVDQLTTARTLINACLDVVDATRWTGDSNNADFIAGQLRLLHDNIQEAKSALKGWTDQQRSWTDDSVDPTAFDPPLPSNLSFHLFISEAALVLVVRTVELAYPNTGTNTPLSLSANSYSGLSIRDRLATALGGSRQPFHDEAHETFTYKGQEVKVRDKIRVESQDPSLMAALAKLGALERSVTVSRRALHVVMGKEHDDA